MRLPWDDDSEIVATPSMQEQIKQLTEEVNTLRLIVAQLSSQMQHMLNEGNTPRFFGGHNPYTTFHGSNGAYETNAPNPYHQTYAPPSLARQMFPRGRIIMPEEADQERQSAESREKTFAEELKELHLSLIKEQQDARDENE